MNDLTTRPHVRVRLELIFVREVPNRQRAVPESVHARGQVADLERKVLLLVPESVGDDPVVMRELTSYHTPMVRERLRGERRYHIWGYNRVIE